MFIQRSLISAKQSGWLSWGAISAQIRSKFVQNSFKQIQMIIKHSSEYKIMTRRLTHHKTFQKNTGRSCRLAGRCAERFINMSSNKRQRLTVKFAKNISWLTGCRVERFWHNFDTHSFKTSLKGVYIINI